ncbi:putative ferric-chelate reductase [Lenzites betulinus]|nr:putative ferric-chelate reductase [Lenzites betulinus]
MFLRTAVTALAVLGLVAPYAAADSLKVTLGLDDINCLFGCVDTLELLTFGDVAADAGYYPSLCQSVYMVTSLALCTDTYCTPTQKAAGWAKVTDYCVEYAETDLMPFDDAKALINSSSVVTIDGLAEAGNQFNSTVALTYDSFYAGLHTENAWNREMNFHHAFGWSLYILVGAMVLVGLVNRVLVTISSRSKQVSVEDKYRAYIPHDKSWSSSVYTLYRKHISTPATFGYLHCQPWGMLSIPTRIQAFFIFAFCLVNLVFTVTCYDLFMENLYWPDDKATQLWRYVADRTGIMSFYNLPLLWALAGRNDVLIWLTGWSYSSMNLFHRWVARVATIQAIIHSAAYTWQVSGDMAENWAELYWRTGVFATVFMCLLLPLSILPIRKKLYEIFLIIHILLALVTLILLFYHIQIFDGEYEPWLWACVGVWVFDRAIRIIRVAVLSFSAFRSGGNTVAIMTGGDQSLIRMTVTSALPLTPKPGDYFFLYTPLSITPWENHPFTLGSWEKNAKGGTDLHFLIAPLDGATRKMKKRIAQSQDGKAHMRVLLEGPYGHSENIGRFEHVLLVAGGSGITAILPYLHELQTTDAAARVTRDVHVVWIVKNSVYAADVLAHELAAAASTDTLHVAVELHLTREAGVQAADFVAAVPAGAHARLATEKSQSDDAKSVGSASTAGPTVLAGRPQMDALIGESLKQLVGGERVAVVACGPARMMDDLRRAVADAYGTGEHQIRGDGLEYFEESFAW